MPKSQVNAHFLPPLIHDCESHALDHPRTHPTPLLPLLAGRRGLLPVVLAATGRKVDPPLLSRRRVAGRPPPLLPPAAWRVEWEEGRDNGRLSWLLWLLDGG